MKEKILQKFWEFYRGSDSAEIEQNQVSKVVRIMFESKKENHPLLSRSTAEFLEITPNFNGFLTQFWSGNWTKRFNSLNLSAKNYRAFFLYFLCSELVSRLKNENNQLVLSKSGQNLTAVSNPFIY